MEKVKKFLITPFGRFTLTAILYVLIFGLLLLCISVFDAPIIAVIFAIAFIYFGWTALSRITPEIFVIMPVGGWIAYFVIKGFLSFFLGVFVAPWVIGKKISKVITDTLKDYDQFSD